MKNKFYDEMRAKHPHLFDVDANESIICFGFETLSGWDKILADLFAKLSDEVRLAQVKSKFGGLRVYADNCTEQDNEYIREAEENADRTCEICGEPGKKHTCNGWISTVCEEHNEQG